MTETTLVDGGALPAVPQPHGLDLDACRLWIEMIREARMLAGPDAARRLWQQSPLPPLPPRRQSAVRKEPRPRPKPAPAEWVSDFLADRTETAPRCRTRADRLWAAYLAWVPRGSSPVSEPTFRKHLARHGLKQRTDRFAYFLNIRLRTGGE